MSRESNDLFDRAGRLIQGFDYDRQAWVQHGRYVACGHPAAMRCNCYGRLHAGENTRAGGAMMAVRRATQRLHEEEEK
jgi:hypothetical protein